MNNSIEDSTQDDSTSNKNDIENNFNTTEVVNDSKNKTNLSVNSIPHIINETIEEEKDEKLVKEKGPGIGKNRVITDSGLRVTINKDKNTSIGASSQSSLATSAIPTDILEEYDSDTSEFPADFKQTTDMLIQLKERILDSSKKMLNNPNDSNKSLNKRTSSLNSESSSQNNLSSSYTGKPYVPTIRYSTTFPNKSYTDLNNSNSNLNSYTYHHNNVSQDSFSSTYYSGNLTANNSSLNKYRKIFEYTEDEIKLFNAIEEYALLPKGRLNPGLEESLGESDEISKLRDEQVLIYKKLNSTRSVLHKEMLEHVNCINEKEELEKKLQELQNLLEEKDKKIEELQTELDTEKGSAESLRKEKQTVQGEVEELTKSLFEEANKLVADEARKRHKVEKINKIISGKLKDSQLQLEAQTEQLTELRKRMEEMNFENLTNKKMMEDNKRISILSSENSEEIAYDINSIDTYLLAEFKDFISSAFNVRMSKLHSIPYMKNCLEDDIMPCLRFSSDPKISWKRLTEEIAANALLLQEISPSANNSPTINRPERSSSISVGNLNNLNNSSLNNQNNQNNRSSMWARLSVQAGFGSGIIYDQVINGCQACGRPNTHSNPIRFQFRIEKYNKNDGSEWSPLCSVCRDRIVACCEFYNFIRHIRQGLYTNRGIAELYYENVRLKRQMFYARVGALNQADYDYGFGKLPKLTQSTTTYKRSLSISQIKSDLNGSNSSIIGSIGQSKTNYPINTESSGESSTSSVTQSSDFNKPNHRVLNLETFKTQNNNQNSMSYLTNTIPSPDNSTSNYYNSDNDDHGSSVVTEGTN